MLRCPRRPLPLPVVILYPFVSIGARMPTIEVAVQRDHLERLANTRPLLGLAELIWNALDAEASNVQVDLHRNPLGGITDVIVTDDGHGFTYAQALDEFSLLGGSWKGRASLTKNAERALHGSRGEGRFRAFAIGPEIRWETVADTPQGRQLTIVEGHLSTIGTFSVEGPYETDAAPHTRVSIAVLKESLGSFESESAHLYLATQFAVYLSAYPGIEISFEHRAIVPADVQERFDRRPLPQLDPPGELIVIEWTTSVPRALYLCDDNGFSLLELPAGVQAPGIHFTGYALSPRLAQLGITDVAVGEMHPEVRPIAEAARAAMREHFKERRNEDRQELIKKWKRDGTYPYAGEPVGAVDEARREAFEVVAVEVADRLPDFPGTSTQATRLSLRLLSESLEQSPDSLHRILDEVLNLGAEEKEDFADLLDRTTLTAMIKASRVVADRLDFCRALEELVFNPQSKNQLHERTQLHRILAKESWLWGEEFNLSADDESLDAVLRAHVSLLGREEIVPEPVEVPEQSGGIVDLMLSRLRHDMRGHRQHLVVELKRPSVKITSDEITQIKKYAYAVSGDERFQNTSTNWTFWLVANDMNDFAEEEADQDRREFGLVVDKPRLKVWVHTWSQLLESARKRLSFFEDQLGYTASAVRAREYLRSKHQEYLPPSMQ